MGGWGERERESVYESVCVCACLNMCLSRFSKLSWICRLRDRVHLRSFLAFRLTSLMTNEGFQPTTPSPLLRVRYTLCLLLSLSLTLCLFLCPYLLSCRFLSSLFISLCLCLCGSMLHAPSCASPSLPVFVLQLSVSLFCHRPKSVLLCIFTYKCT